MDLQTHYRSRLRRGRPVVLHGRPVVSRARDAVRAEIRRLLPVARLPSATTVVFNGGVTRRLVLRHADGVRRSVVCMFPYQLLVWNGTCTSPPCYNDRAWTTSFVVLRGALRYVPVHEDVSPAASLDDAPHYARRAEDDDGTPRRYPNFAEFCRAFGITPSTCVRVRLPVHVHAWCGHMQTYPRTHGTELSIGVLSSCANCVRTSCLPANPRTRHFATVVRAQHMVYDDRRNMMGLIRVHWNTTSSFRYVVRTLARCTGTTVKEACAALAPGFVVWSTGARLDHVAR